MFRNPSLDTCIEVLRDNSYIVLEEENAKKKPQRARRNIWDEFVKAVENWLKGKIVVDL